MDAVYVVWIFALVVGPPIGWILAVLVMLAMLDRRARIDNVGLILACFSLLINSATALVLWWGDEMLDLSNPFWFNTSSRLVSLAALALSAFGVAVCVKARHAR